MLDILFASDKQYSRDDVFVNHVRTMVFAAVRKPGSKPTHTGFLPLATLKGSLSKNGAEMGKYKTVPVTGSSESMKWIFNHRSLKIVLWCSFKALQRNTLWLQKGNMEYICCECQNSRIICIENNCLSKQDSGLNLQNKWGEHIETDSPAILDIWHLLTFSALWKKLVEFLSSNMFWMLSAKWKTSFEYR